MKTFYLISVFTLLILAGCKDNNEEEEQMVAILDPAQYILGKWQEISCGNAYYPELSTAYHIFHTIEFLSDGTYYGPLALYSKDDGEPSHYQIESDSLILYREGHQSNIYRYLFTGKNQLLTEHIYGFSPYSGVIPTFHIYERIK
jgi:hypothetical protein